MTSTATGGAVGEIDAGAPDRRVARRVDGDPEPLQPGERARAHDRVVLADAGGEDDRVGAARARPGTRRRTCGSGSSRRRARARRPRRRPRSGGAPRACRCRPPAPSRPAARVQRGVDLVDATAGACAAGGARAPGRRRPSACPSRGPRAASAPSTCRRCGRRPRRVALAPLPRCSTIMFERLERAPEQRARPRARRTRARCRGSRSGGRPTSPRHGVGVRARRQRVVERGVEDGDVRHVRERPPRRPRSRRR